MKVSTGEKAILIKYSGVYKKNPMEIHLDFLKQNGYVWFGKTGLRPTEKVVNSYKNEDGTYKIILYSAKYGIYLCEASKIEREKPEDTKFVDYYYDLIKSDPAFFKSFYKITKVEEVEREFLNNFILTRTRSQALDSLYNSMGSLFYIEKRS